MLGATKRLAEMTCQALVDPRSTRMVIVRFGNVLDSSGSVVPLFREQIRRGGGAGDRHPSGRHPLFHDDPRGLPILQAASIGAQQAVYTLDMGSRRRSGCWPSK